MSATDLIQSNEKGRWKMVALKIPTTALMLACASFVQAVPPGASAETAEDTRPPRSQILFLPRDTSPDTPEHEIQQEFRRDKARIYALRKSPTRGQPDDLSAYEKAARDVERTWRGRDKEYYAWLMLELCASVSHGHISFDDPRHELKRKYALSVLEAPDEIPLELELRAVGQVAADMGTPARHQGEEFARRRREDVRVRLHAWKRLIDAVDPDWDPNDRPRMNIIPPGDGRAGMSPEHIKDPTLRAEYEAAIRRNAEKARRHVEQSFVRKWLDDFPVRAERFIIALYSKAPFDLAELGQYLDESMPDDKTTKIRILSAVRGNIGGP